MRTIITNLNTDLSSSKMLFTEKYFSGYFYTNLLSRWFYFSTAKMNPICDTPVVTVPTKTIKEIGKIYNKNIFNTAPNISRMAYKNGLFSESIVVLTNPTISTKTHAI